MGKFHATGIMILFFLMFLWTCSADQMPETGVMGTDVWNGTWESDLFILAIQQNGSVISGIYHPKEGARSDAGVLEGMVSPDGKTCSGTWTDTGPFRFVMNNDAMSFSGSVGISLNGEVINPVTSTSNGTRMIPSFDPDNIWSGTWISPRITNTWIQAGNRVTGSYKPFSSVNDEPGILEGVVSEDGRALSGNWTETGKFSFTLSADSSYFNGTYTWESGLSAPSESWNGVRIG
jgi:hypothetical protein